MAPESDWMTSIIVYYPDGKYEDQEISLDGAVLEGAKIEFHFSRQVEYVFEDWSNPIFLEGIPFPIPTPTTHATDLRVVGEDNSGILIIPTKKKKAHHLKFRAQEIELQNKQYIVLKDVYFLSGCIKDLE